MEKAEKIKRCPFRTLLNSNIGMVAKPIMEKVYPGFEFVRGLRFQEDETGSMSESCVRFSDYTDGVYIRVMMRRKAERGKDRG